MLLRLKIQQSLQSKHIVIKTFMSLQRDYENSGLKVNEKFE